MRTTVRRAGWLAAWFVLCLPLSPAMAGKFCRPPDLERINASLGGKVLDFTHNHGADRRLWSPALHESRDLYVYLPPGFDCSQQYPVLLWLHGFMQDEKAFIDGVVQLLDQAIVSGKLPPMIMAAPDGSLKGTANVFSAGSFYINSNAGNFEDYLIQDVWSFLNQNYPIRPEREAHVIAGLSMGGFAAYNLGIKHQDLFKNVLGVFPPLNLRWLDCHGRYMGNFDPDCWGWRTSLGHGFEPVGRFYCGLVVIRLKRVIDPLFGLGPDALANVTRENPIEMIDTYALPPGALNMFVAYAGKDEFNIDAQVESFLFRAKERDLDVGVAYEPKGRHNFATALKLFPCIVKWLNCELAPFGPVPIHGPDTLQQPATP